MSPPSQSEDRHGNMRNSIKLSLILPAFNESASIEEAINRVDQIVKKTEFPYELIVVDDGSTDDTMKRATNYASNNGHVKVISYQRNMGKGHAIKTGFLHATGDAVVLLDSDLDIDPTHVAACIEALNYSDLVIASKWHPKSKVEMPLFRRILSHGFNILVKLLTGVKLADTQTGLKAIRKNPLASEIFSKLVVKRYAYDAEMLALANLFGLKIVELPVNIRMHGLFNFKEVWKMFIDLLGIAYRLFQNRYRNPSK